MRNATGRIGMELFNGTLIRLARLDGEQDAAVESGWTHDPEYLRLFSTRPLQPLAPFQLKKLYEAEEKSEMLFPFGIRTQKDDRLVGVARLDDVEWTHGAAQLHLGIGRSEDRGQGYGSEALWLLLRYAFVELNLYRVSASVAEHNVRGAHFLERAGFTLEVRRRQALAYAGRHWDALIYGLLREG